MGFFINTEASSEINVNRRVSDIARKYGVNNNSIKIKYESESEFYSGYPGGYQSGVYGYYNPDKDNYVHVLKKEFVNESSLFYEDLIVHECTHAIIHKLNPKCSMKLIEGICVYESGQLKYFDDDSCDRSEYCKYAKVVEEVVNNGGYSDLKRMINGKDSKYTILDENVLLELERTTAAGGSENLDEEDEEEDTDYGAPGDTPDDEGGEDNPPAPEPEGGEDTPPTPDEGGEDDDTPTDYGTPDTDTPPDDYDADAPEGDEPPAADTEPAPAAEPPVPEGDPAPAAEPAEDDDTPIDYGTPDTTDANDAPEGEQPAPDDGEPPAPEGEGGDDDAPTDYGTPDTTGDEGGEGDEPPTPDGEEGADGEGEGDDAETGDEGSETDAETSGDEYTEDGDELGGIEKVLFSDLSDQQINIRIIELKKSYLELYKSIETIIDKVNKISKTDENIVVIEFIVNKLSDLRTIVDDYLTKTFPTKTYIENSAEYQRYLAVLHSINKLLKELAPKVGIKTKGKDLNVNANSAKK